MADALAKGHDPQSTDAEPRSRDDAFVRGIAQFWSWFRKNLRTVLVGLAGSAMIVAGILYYVNFRATVREQAAGDLARLRSSAATPDILISDLEIYVGRFAGTPAANEARIILARIYMDTGRATEAIGVLEAIGAAPDRPIGFAARSLLAAAQEATGDADKALATWATLGSRARFAFQRRQAQASVARLHAEGGRIDEASAIYAAIAEEAEETNDLAEAGVYRIRLGELAHQRGRGSD